MKDAEECGDLIRDMHNLEFDFGFASALVRTQKTLQLVLEHAGMQCMFAYS
jgi:bisphosphoglycerate-dependent phosphoglycerate mutase